MNRPDDESGETSGYASPPCYAAEIDPAYFDPLAVSAQQAADVARWRRAERVRLRDARMHMSSAERAIITEALIRQLDRFVTERFGAVEGRVVSGYWPIKGELDLRSWLTSLHHNGAIVALPVVVVPGTPLVFRRWAPGMKMERGHWNIPVPPADAAIVTPEIALAPVVGWDRASYRLGYGGGYFDRTLAALAPRPMVIGIGLQSAEIATIYPQPHDVPMSVIVTENGVQAEFR